jgi:DNA-binding NarL/FixJ family response regulator
MNILIADDHKLVCESLGKVIRGFPDVERIHFASNGKEAISIVKDQKIDIVFLDARMPVMDGVSAAKILLQTETKLKVISMTMFGSSSTIIDLFRIGVHGILLKENSDCTNIEMAIVSVINGKKYYSEGIYNTIIENIDLVNEPSRLHFTPRELDVLKHTCEGLVAKEIGEKLNISAGSIENYRKELLRKTKTKNVAQLIYFASQNGIV